MICVRSFVLASWVKWQQMWARRGGVNVMRFLVLHQSHLPLPSFDCAPCGRDYLCVGTHIFELWAVSQCLRFRYAACAIGGKLDTNASNALIAPSPDVVTLVGLRFPNAVGTTVMRLDAILSKLKPHEIAELKKPQFSIQTQDIFKTGILDELRHALTLLDVPLLKATSGKTHGRFSHRNVSSSEEYPLGEQAAEEFKEACEQVAKAVVVAPGDVLLVSNRICRHGRGVVGEAVGGEAYWLLRTYVLDTTGLDEGRRHHDDRPLHVLYP